MSYFDAIFLGILQGLTEFLPVSSSGHLVLAEHILHAKNPGVAFELVVHLGTLLSVLIYFRRRILTLLSSFFKKTETDTRRMNYLLLVATIPAVIAGVFFKDFFESAFSAPVMTSIFLMVTGLILLLTALVPKGDNVVTLWRAIFIGIGQAIAILPGISRSGSTISAGLFAGVNPVAAAEFSFLLSIPTIAGAIVSMAQRLGHRVIAEGVETADQLTFLRGLGCQEIQGYLFSPPVQAEKLEAMVRDGRVLKLA